MDSGFKKLLNSVQENLSGLEKISIVATLLVALATPLVGSVYVLGQQQNVLDNLNTRLNSLPTSEEFNLQLQLRDVRLQRIEYQIEQITREMKELRELMERTHNE